jgi:hypothetical protein
VKSPFLLPLYLVSVFLLFLAGFTLATMLWAWIGLAPHGSQVAMRAVLEDSAALVEQCLIAALLPALFLTAVRVVRNPVSRPFSLLLPVVTAFCLLYFVPRGLRALPRPAGEAAAVVVTSSAYLPAGVLVTNGATGARRTTLLARRVAPVAAEPEMDDAALEDVVAFRAEPPERHLSYYPRGRASLAGDEVVVRLEDPGSAEREGVVVRVPAHSTFRALVEPSASTGRLLADLEITRRELDRDATELGKVGFVLGLTSFLWFSAFVLRMTRWPLLGFVLLGLLWRGALIAVRFTVEVVRPGLEQLVRGMAVGPLLSQEATSLLLIAGAILCLAFDLLFVRFDFWKREIEA